MRVTFDEGSSHEALPPVESTLSLIGVPLALARPDGELVQAARQVLRQKLRSLAVRTAVVADKKQHWYRYRIQPIYGTTNGNKDEDKDCSAIGGLTLVANEIAAREASKLRTEYFTHDAHETRTPLAGIMAIAEVLLPDLTLSGQNRSLVKQILRSGEILLEMIGIVLDMRRLEVGQLKLERRTFHTAGLIPDAKLLAVLAKGKGLDYIRDIRSYNPGPLRGARGRLRQVIANGLSNAAKFTDTGSVTFRVGQTSDTSASLRLCFDIIDTCCGIAPSFLPTLFRPFQQADLSTASRCGGARLGLAISCELMSLVGGTVGLQSAVGQGTMMTLEMKLEKDLSGTGNEAAEAGAAQKPDTHSSAERETKASAAIRKPESVWILIGEDNKLLRDLYVRILRQRGFSGVAVADGQQAIGKVHSGEPFDLILMDGQVPVKDGYQAIREIRTSATQIVAYIKIVALTASAFEGDRERCLAVGMDGYLSMPLNWERTIWQQLE
jgi:signal transduction histidine kinase/CheY-like chemotaxis protein